MLRRFLDRVYLVSGGTAAVCILAICLLVTAQVCLNILARVGGPEWSYTIPSYADFSGYFLASASFLAMAYTLRSSAHIRVNLIIERLNIRSKWFAEMFTLTIGGGLSGYASWFCVLRTIESWQYGDKSYGIIAVPLWIPQTVMVIGLVLLCVAFFDTLVESIRARRPILTDMGSTE